jgi:hypothetical protein
MTYTTQDLIQILEQELRATWKGERIIFSTSEKIDNPVVSKAIDLQKVGKVFVYRDFRRQIHQYQQENQVSGIVWRSTNFQGKSVCFPEVHAQLIALEGDKQILISAKQSVLNFWRDVTREMKFYLAGDRLNPLPGQSLEQLYQDAEWAEVDAGRGELYLGLCWGNPNEYIYRWARPESGCHRLIAAIERPSSINIT